MILGVALSALVKFEAPTLTRPVALDVGRHVFGIFNSVELALALIATGLMAAAQTDRKRAIPLLALWLVLIIDKLWLLPALSWRAEQLLAGETLAPSPLHAIYLGLEGLKLALLSWAAYRSLH